MANYKFVQVAENRVRMYAKSNDFDPSGKGFSFDGYITGSDICAVVQDANLLKVDVVLNTQNHTFLIDTNEDVITIAGTQHSPSTLTAEEAFDLLEGALPNICSGESQTQNLQSVTDGEGNNATTNNIVFSEVLKGFEFANGVKIFGSDEAGVIYLTDENNGVTRILTLGAATSAYNLNFPSASGTIGLSVSINGSIPNVADEQGNIDIPIEDYADDTAAAAGNVAIGQLYHTAGTVKIRLT